MQVACVYCRFPIYVSEAPIFERLSPLPVSPPSISPRCVSPAISVPRVHLCTLFDCSPPPCLSPIQVPLIYLRFPLRFSPVPVLPPWPSACGVFRGLFSSLISAPRVNRPTPNPQLMIISCLPCDCCQRPCFSPAPSVVLQSSLSVHPAPFAVSQTCFFRFPISSAFFPS